MIRAGVLSLVIAAVVTAGCAAGDGAATQTSTASGSTTTTAPTSTTTASTATTSTTTTTSATTESTTTGVPATDPAATDPPATTVPAATDPPATGEPAVVTRTLDGRTYDLVVPSSADGATSMPLVVLLHGYTASAAIQESYFQLTPLAETRGFLLAVPDGIVDGLGDRFWNATDACCNFTGSDVDDVAHLLAVVDAVAAEHPVDPDSVHLVGHSNGGFMSYRMACEHADVFASVVSLAGATYADPEVCRPSAPVRIVQIHGTADAVIGYEGGEFAFSGPYPGALETAATWAAANGCDGGTEAGEAVFDLDAGIDGPDTAVTTFSGCPADGHVELWTIDGGGHVPPLTDEFRVRVVEAMLGPG